MVKHESKPTVYNSVFERVFVMKKTKLTDGREKENEALKEIFNNKKKELGLTQAILAEKLDVSQGAVNMYLNSINPLNTQIASRFAELLNVQVSDFSPRLAAEIERMAKNVTPASTAPRINEITDIHRPMLWSNNTPLPKDDYVFAPFLKETELRGGDGSFEIPDYNGFRLPFGKATLHRKGIMPDNVICCTLTGDSMEPRIPEYATIAVDKGIENIRDGKIYAFQHGELFRVKYLSRLPGNKVRIRSENENYEDEIVDGEDIRIIGRVFWWSVLD